MKLGWKFFSKNECYYLVENLAMQLIFINFYLMTENEELLEELGGISKRSNLEKFFIYKEEIPLQVTFWDFSESDLTIFEIFYGGKALFKISFIKQLLQVLWGNKAWILRIMKMTCRSNKYLSNLSFFISEYKCCWNSPGELLGLIKSGSQYVKNEIYILKLNKFMGKRLFDQFDQISKDFRVSIQECEN